MNWWFDIMLALTVLLLVYVAIKLNRMSSRPNEKLSELWTAGDAVRHNRLYPRSLIRQNGIVPDEFRLIYWGGKSLLAGLLPMSMAEIPIASNFWYLYGVAAVLGFFCIDGILLYCRKRRKLKIERNLSYFVDLIVAFLHSGLTLSESFQRAAEYGLPKHNPLSFEVQLVSRELSAGLERQQAFLNLAHRTGVVGMYRLAAVLDVGFSSGASVGSILNGQADLLRQRQWDRGAELIDRKALEAMLPMALVSIPLLMVLIFFPAAIQLLGALALFRESFL